VTLDFALGGLIWLESEEITEENEAVTKGPIAMSGAASLPNRSPERRIEHLRFRNVLGGDEPGARKSGVFAHDQDCEGRQLLKQAIRLDWLK